MRGELFQHLSLGQVLSRTISMFADRFDVYMALSTTVFVPMFVIGLLNGAVIVTVIGTQVLDFVSKDQVVDENSQDVYDENDILAKFVLNASTHLILLVGFLVLVELPLALVVGVSGEAGIVRAAAETYAAEDGQLTNYTGWWACLVKFGVRRFCHLCLGQFYTGLPVCLGLAVCLVWLVVGLLWQSGFLLVTWVLSLGMWVGLLFWWFASVALTLPVMVVERKGPKDAIRRSFEITKGRRFYVACASLILTIVKIICAQLLRIIFVGTDSVLEAVFKPVGVIVGFVPLLLYLPLHNILTFCLYASIRADKEGLTRSVLQRELWDQPVSSVAPCADYGKVPLTESDNTDVMAQELGDFA